MYAHIDLQSLAVVKVTCIHVCSCTCMYIVHFVFLCYWSSSTSRWCAIQSRGFAALGNLLSALPRGALGDLEGGVLAVWQRVVELVVSGGVALSDDVTSLLVVLTKVMQNEEIQVQLTM